MLKCCSKFANPLVRIPASNRLTSSQFHRLYATVNPSQSAGLLCLKRFYIISPGVECCQRRHASTDDCKPPLIPTSVKRFFYIQLGATIVTIAGVVVYAKQDPKFRETIENYIPGFDKFIAFVYQEPGSEITLDNFTDRLLSLPNDLYNQISKAIEGGTKYIKQQEAAEEGTQKSVTTPKPSEDQPAESEDPILKLGNDAINLYKEGIKLIEGKEDNIPALIDKAVEANDPKLWNNIKKQIAEQNKDSVEVERIEKEADDLTKKYLTEKKSLISKEKLSEAALKGLTDTEVQLNGYKKKLKSLKASKLDATKNYFKKIEDGRKHLLEELNTLFPGIRLSERQTKLREEELDLFLYYAVQKLNYYQKEIAKLESQALDKLNKVVQGNPSLREAIDSEVDKARRQIKEDFDQQMVDVKASCEKGLQEQMKRQEQVHLDLLNEQLILKEKEVERKLMQQLEARVQEEQNRLTQELAEMTGRMQALNEAISKRALQDMKAQTSQALWSASEDLYNKLKRSQGDSASPECVPIPLAKNVEAIRKAAAEGDDLVETVLATIPAMARDRGVFPEDSLRERFLKVESVAWRVAGISEGGASLPRVWLAWLQSALVLRASEPIPSPELNNQPIDAKCLNNYDILQRARYYVDRGNFEQALRYMNLLKGGARAVSSDWTKEVTLLLESQQAAALLLAHATASGMVYS